MVAERHLLRVPLAKLAPDSRNPRENAPPDAAFVEDVGRRGLIHPLSVGVPNAQGIYPIHCGHRRFYAAKAAGLADVLVLVTEGAPTPGEVVLEQIAENRHRRDLNPIETARAFRRALDLLEWPRARLAKEQGLDESTLSRSLALLDLPVDGQTLIAKGLIAPSTALELAKNCPPGEFAERARALAAKGITRQQLVRARSDEPASPRSARCVLALPDGATVAVSLPNAPDLATVIGALEAVLASARSASRHGLGLGTLTQMLRDRAREPNKRPP